MIDREAPYKVIAKPLEGRIHFGKDNDTPAAGRRKRKPAPAGASGRRSRRPPAAGIDRSAARRRRLGRRGRARRPGAGAGRAGPRPGARHRDAPGRAPTASRSPSTTVPTRRARRPCSRSCASTARRRPSSSPASRSMRRPALVAEIVAAGHRVELHCHRHRNLLRLSAREFLDDAERAAPRSRRRAARRSPTTARPTGSSAPRPCAPCAVAAGGRCSGHAGGGTGTAARNRRVDRPSLKHRHPAPATSSSCTTPTTTARRGSWVRTAAALPLILDGAREPRAEDDLAAPLRGRGEGPLVAAGERFVEASRHRAPGPVLVEDFPGHGSPSCRGR